MTQILTSSFFTRLPADVARISIARWSPKGHRDLPTIRELTPGDWFKTASAEEYRLRFLAQLAALDAHAIVARIEDLAAGRRAALLCWEKPSEPAWCHRSFVSAWLQDELGIEAREFGREADGCGHNHPKLPAPATTPKA